ncbi:MAG: M28 family metallopeptidase [Verrucomicrobiota bacterium]
MNTGPRKALGLLALISVSSLLLLSCRDADKSSPRPGNAEFIPLKRFNPDRAYEEVKNFVALGPRVSGTTGASKAADYIAERLREYGYQPVIDDFIDNTPEGKKTFRNIVAVAAGNTDTAIVLVSHYDTKAGISPDFAGANDSGSSTGLLLELMRTAWNAPANRPDIIGLFVDGEECLQRYSSYDGLHGSRHFVRTLILNRRADRIVAAIILDMIGDQNLNIKIPANSVRDLISETFEAAKREGFRNYFHLSEGYIIDDHVPFLNAGIPAVNLIDFEFGSSPGKNDYWHTTNDTLDKISRKSLEITGRTTLRLVNRLCADAQPPE